MNKYQVSVFFTIEGDFMSHIPAHRAYINSLILKGVIDQYAISAERGQGWITMNAKNKSDIIKYLQKTPLFPYFKLEIDDLMVFDGKAMRFPRLVLN
jgi:hypothetical protein